MKQKTHIDKFFLSIVSKRTRQKIRMTMNQKKARLVVTSRNMYKIWVQHKCLSIWIRPTRSYKHPIEEKVAKYWNFLGNPAVRIVAKEAYNSIYINYDETHELMIPLTEILMKTFNARLHVDFMFDEASYSKLEQPHDVVIRMLHTFENFDIYEITAGPFGGANLASDSVVLKTLELCQSQWLELDLPVSEDFEIPANTLRPYHFEEFGIFRAVWLRMDTVLELFMDCKSCRFFGTYFSYPDLARFFKKWKTGVAMVRCRIGDDFKRFKIRKLMKKVKHVFSRNVFAFIDYEYFERDYYIIENVHGTKAAIWYCPDSNFIYMTTEFRMNDKIV